MKKGTFLNCEKPIITCMVQAETPERVKELIDRSLPNGAEAFGMQFCRMKPEYQNKKTYKELIKYAKEKPVYVTNYRLGYNEGKSDEELAKGLITLAECGATLCDVMGDLFDKQDDELARDENAIEKQMKLIDELHARGVEVLMSSHVFKFTPAERVLEIALEHQRRGADICKIVTGADDMAQQIENMRIINLLKETLKIPFLFLCGGECNILRRIGGELGNCMSLCTYEHDELATKAQPLLKDQKEKYNRRLINMFDNVAGKALGEANDKYVVIQVVLTEKVLGTGSGVSSLTNLQNEINKQAAKGYRLHTISTTSSGSKGFLGGDKIQATMVFERID